MFDSNSPAPDAVVRFYDNYLNCLQKASIPEKQRRWYVKRIEAFIKTYSGRKIKSLTGQEVSGHLGMIGRQNRLSGWQFAQCIDAIRILYCELLSTPACQGVDWEYWKDSARQLDIDHPTTARQLSPEELSYLKERKGEGSLQQVRASHRELLVRLANEIRVKGYAWRTEQTYEQWICRYILFCKGVSPKQAGATGVKSFLEYLAIRRHVSASTQNQALNALVFLYDKVLGQKLGELDAFTRAKRSHNLPVVLSRNEVMSLLQQLQGIHKLIASVLYGTGMRLLEGLRLRVQDVDFDYHRIHGEKVRAGTAREAALGHKLERLCRYITRPAISEKRLSLTNNGNIRYELKTPYRDGTTHVIFEPVDFIAKLAALVPRPRVNLTRFHGVFAPNSKHRAQRLKRVFNIDVETCRICGGSAKVIACIEDPVIIKKILTHLEEKSPTRAALRCRTVERRNPACLADSKAP